MRTLRTIAEARDGARGRAAAGRPRADDGRAARRAPARCSRARASECATVVMSLFVNPTQFGGGRGPRGLPARRGARRAARRARPASTCCSRPTPREMYPPGFATTVVGRRAAASRSRAPRAAPRTSTRVATVVAKLLNIVGPQVAYFGQKDAQQALVIARMARDLDIPTRIEVCPTVREPDGLARSSRNAYLDDGAARAGRRRSRAALRRGRGADRRRRARRRRGRRGAACDELRRHGIEPDYVALVDPQTLAAGRARRRARCSSRSPRASGRPA